MDIKYNKIGEALEKKKKTGYWLARVLDVSDSVVNRWVHQKRQPSLQVLHEIATALKVDVKTLLVKTEEVREQLPERFAEIEDNRSGFPKKRGPKPKDV